MKDDKILAAVTLDDIQDDTYLGLIERYKEAGYGEQEAIRLSLLTGMELGGMFAIVKKIDSIYDRTRKRLAMLDRKAGIPYQAIARKYDFSEQTIRALERNEQAEKLAKRQLRLPGA